MNDRASDTRLREAFRAPLQIAADGADCPPTDRLWEAAHGELDRNAVAEVLLHCGECGACAEGWRLVRAAEAGTEAGVGRDAPVAGTGRVRLVPGRLRLIAAVAATIVVVGLIAVVVQRPPSAPDPLFRGEVSAAIRSTTGDEALPRDRCRLSWTPAAEGARYDLRVMTEQLDLLHVAWDLDEPSHEVPAEALQSLPAGSRILWQVTIRSADGEAEVSETFGTALD